MKDQADFHDRRVWAGSTLSEPARIRCQPVWDPPVAVPRVAMPAPIELPISEILDIILEPADPRETAHARGQRKEHELAARFHRLSVQQSTALHKRLSNPSTTDQLANAFLRFTVERRTRLLAFLAGAKRRAALAR